MGGVRYNLVFGIILLSIILTGCVSRTEYVCPDGSTVSDSNLCPKVTTASTSTTTLAPCPYECCMDDKYQIKKCPSGYGCVENKCILGDSDGDGYNDKIDAFPYDPSEHQDSDGDGYGDNSDAFPHNSKEWKDSDGDRHGDNEDEFPHDPTEWADSDNDNYGDNSDAFPRDPTEWKDSDSDGYGDNKDVYPYDNSKHTGDSDNDGLLDEEEDINENGVVDAGETDSHKKDTEGDGVPDGYDPHPLLRSIRITKDFHWWYKPSSDWLATEFSFSYALEEDVIQSYDLRPMPTSLKELINYDSWEIDSLVNILNEKAAEHGYDYYNKVMFVIAFTRSLDYQYNKVDQVMIEGVQLPYWTQFPVQTIMRKEGVCADSAVLAAAILKKMGYDVVYVGIYPCKDWIYKGQDLSNLGHAVIGVVGDPSHEGQYVIHNGKKYYLIDATGGRGEGNIIFTEAKYPRDWGNTMCSPGGKIVVIEV